MEPYVTASSNSGAEARWIGESDPSLQAATDGRFDLEVPGYDFRHMILTRDPLAAVLACSVQVRCVLATLFGVRMCPDCPRCAESENPCQDFSGSSAEAMGGLAGRSDALAGAVECQKKRGSLHLHSWNYVQRAPAQVAAGDHATP